MTLRIAAFAVALALGAPAIAFAQAGTPQIILDRAKMMAGVCAAAGGRPGNGDRPLTYNLDVTGDGKADWLLDSAGFGCIGKANMFRSAQGAALEVFVNDGRGGAKSAFIATVYTFRTTGAKPAKIFITLRGAACGSTNATCEKPLGWNAATKKFTAGSAAPVVAAAPPSAGARAASGAGPAQAAGGGYSGAPFTVTAADKTAAFKAAGFKQTRRGWQRCADAEGADSLSYTPGEISQTPDLNKDGRPEIWIREGGAMCYGNSGGLQVILAKTSAGQWKVVLDEVTDPTVLNTRHNGWADIQAGGPGMGPWGAWRFDGAKYAFKGP